MRVSDPGFKGGDRTEIELPAIQREVLALLKKSGKKTVFVNFSGSAMAIVPETQNCDAILQAWYPGQAGGTAVADVLFGDYNPAGRLPITFYKSMQQLPDYEDYSMKGRTYVHDGNTSLSIRLRFKLYPFLLWESYPEPIEADQRRKSNPYYPGKYVGRETVKKWFKCTSAVLTTKKVRKKLFVVSNGLALLKVRHRTPDRASVRFFRMV